jgi:hypothetical protein
MYFSNFFLIREKKFRKYILSFFNKGKKVFLQKKSLGEGGRWGMGKRILPDTKG